MKYIILMLLVYASFTVSGNDTTSFDLRRNIYFSISMDIFMSPTYGKTKYIDNTIHINYDEKEQITGQKIKFGFGFKLFHERLFLRHSISVKYGHLYFETTSLDTSHFGFIAYNKSIKKVTFDQNVDISYPFYIKDFSISPIVGFSWMNLHSEYSYSIPGNSSYTGDFLMKGFYFGVSLSKKMFEISLNLHYINKENTRYKEVKNIFIPSLSFSYNINKNL